MPRKRTMTSDLLTKQQGEVIKVGFLKKKGHVRRNWLDRWFVLTTEGMYYYKNRLDEKPVGVVPLFGSTAKEDTLQKHQHVFTCWTAEGKDYPVQASTRDEMMVWLKAISDAVTEREKRPSDATGEASKNPAAKGGAQDTPKKNGASAGAAKPDSDESSDED
ncbi:pleckstrin homology domain-containing family A member 1-like [Halichondria panicea]|uniref:pleckstrin homology domain-containing family A member 1-like n=1 Tax=Halichondria panicea TaxID=6063 RepID=UPI00312B4D33